MGQEGLNDVFLSCKVKNFKTTTFLNNTFNMGVIYHITIYKHNSLIEIISEMFSIIRVHSYLLLVLGTVLALLLTSFQE